MLLAVADSYQYSVTKDGTTTATGTKSLTTTSDKISTPIAPNFTPTYLGQTVTIPRDTSALTAEQDSRAINTAIAQTEEKRLGFIDSIVNGAGKILDAFGVEVTASGNGVSVYRAPSVGGTVYETNAGATPWHANPFILIGGAAIIVYALSRK
jgi:hypothetical protein